MSDAEHKGEDNSFWVGLFLGGLIGAGLIVLLGTDKGKRLAKKLQTEGLDFLDDVAEKVEDTVEELEEKGSELVEKGKELVGEGKAVETRVLQSVEEVKEDLSTQAMEKPDEALAPF